MGLYKLLLECLKVLNFVMVVPFCDSYYLGCFVILDTVCLLCLRYSYFVEIDWTVKKFGVLEFLN